MSENRTVRVVTAVLGLSCIASAVWFARRPAGAARAVALPARAAVGKRIAVRDLAVGSLLLVPSSQRAALALRAASDAFDAGLMVSAWLRGDRSFGESAPFVAGALTLSRFSWALRSRLLDRSGTRAHELVGQRTRHHATW